MFVLGEGASYGVDINTGGIADSFANFVWEPAVVKVSVCSPVVIYMIIHIHMQWADIFFNVGYVVWHIYWYLSSFPDKCHKCCYRGSMSYFKCWWDCEKSQGIGFSLFKMIDWAYC